MAAGTLVGPVLAGWLKEQFGWEVMCWVMGAFVASGSVPVVRIDWMIPVEMRVVS